MNGLYGAFEVVDEETAEELKHGKLPEPGERERLLGRGHLTEDPEREKEDLRILARADRKLGRSAVGLVLLPTYDCNLRCSYCFEKHRLAKGESWLQKTMTREMADAVFTAAEGLKKRGLKVGDCTLFGGEPLLKENIDLIRYISRKAKNLSMDIGAITNGYDLDSYIGLLKEFSFKNLQITLDGKKLQHGYA